MKSTGALTKKHALATLTAAITLAFLVTACESVSGPAFNESPSSTPLSLQFQGGALNLQLTGLSLQQVCSGESVRLLAGQSIESGSVIFGNSDNSWIVSINSENGWFLSEIHLAIGTSLADLPTNKSGNPVPGQYPYKISLDPEDQITEYHFSGYLNDLNATTGTELFIAVHAVVVKTDDELNITASESAWAEGTRFVNKGNWATYAKYTVSECETPPAACNNDPETAWAAGSRYVQQGNWATWTSYSGEEKTVDLMAGQTILAGTVTFKPHTDGVEIVIETTGNWIFAQSGSQNWHVQGYSEAPSGNPAPGQFANKGTASGTQTSIVVPESAFYGIHVVVAENCD